jgi:hypothetical protein
MSLRIVRVETEGLGRALDGLVMAFEEVEGRRQKAVTQWVVGVQFDGPLAVVEHPFGLRLPSSPIGVIEMGWSGGENHLENFTLSIALDFHLEHCTRPERSHVIDDLIELSWFKRSDTDDFVANTDPRLFGRHVR